MQLVHDDPWLAPYHQALSDRHGRFLGAIHSIIHRHGSLRDWANAHLYFGFHRGTKGHQPGSQPGYWYREWAPGASQLSLIGEFNNWQAGRHPLERNASGVWEVFIADGADGCQGLRHGQKLKVQVISNRGIEDRIPLYIKRAVQDPATLDFAGVLWDPPSPFVWSDGDFQSQEARHSLKDRPPLIYEAHVGMALEKPGIGTYAEFQAQILPRIKSLNYNTIQLMAIMEHPYYGSFGYHVSNFFAVSSRFGTPDDLKELINEAHRQGIRVLLDIVHSHAASNTREGLAGFDGTPFQFFHDGPRGYHQAWDSKLFDYGKPEVQHFLLSNLKYWLEEYHFDGFRFDGVTSMLYKHHGYGVSFDHYDRYFREEEVDSDAILYLQLANALIHELNPQGISIAEDVSGMPGLAAPLGHGGLGFDYRLAMGLPDFWVQLVTKVRDEDWSLEGIFNTMVHRRKTEKHIAYVESHDQSLVGDKTLIFRMADALMYEKMHQDVSDDLMDRAISLSKVIRLITATCGGEGYLNFMGHEFGHPEWVDFPREGNQWSYQFARRQWSLVDHPKLRYREIYEFDQSLMMLLGEYPVLRLEDGPKILAIHEDLKILVYHRGGLVFAVNLHVHHDCTDFSFETPSLAAAKDSHECRVILTTEVNKSPKCDLNPFKSRRVGSRMTISLPHRNAMVVMP